MSKEEFLYTYMMAYNKLDHEQTELNAKLYFQEKIENGLYIYFLRNIIIHEFLSDEDFDHLDLFIGFSEIMKLFERPASPVLQKKLDGYIINRFGQNFLETGFVLSSFNDESIQVLYEKKTRFKGLTKKILIQNNYQNIVYVISNYSYELHKYVAVHHNPDITTTFINQDDKIVMKFNPIDSSFNLMLACHFNNNKPILLEIDSKSDNWTITVPNDSAYDIGFNHLGVRRVTSLSKIDDEIDFWKIFRYYFNDIYDLIKYNLREIKRFENEVLNNFKTNKIKELYN